MVPLGLHRMKTGGQRARAALWFYKADIQTKRAVAPLRSPLSFEMF